MSNFVWPSDEGWPYPDAEGETADPFETAADDEVLGLRASPHLLDHLDPLERQVIAARYGLDGAPARTMKQLHAELNIPREQLREVLGAGLAKLRDELA